MKRMNSIEAVGTKTVTLAEPPGVLVLSSGECLGRRPNLRALDAVLLLHRSPPLLP